MNRYLYCGFALLLAVGLGLIWREAVQACEPIVDGGPQPVLMFTVDRANLPPGVVIDDSRPFLLFITNTTAVNLYLLTLEQWTTYPENKQRVLDLALSIPPGENWSALEPGEWSGYIRSLSSPATEQPQLYFVVEGEPVVVPYTISEVPDPTYDRAVAQTREAQSYQSCQEFRENESQIVETDQITTASEERGTAVTTPWLLLIVVLASVGLFMARAILRQKREP